MGRWGHRTMTMCWPLPLKLADYVPGLFEADADIDFACEISGDFVMMGGTEDLVPSNLIHQTDMLAPPEAKDYYKTKEYRLKLDNDIVSIRNQLDSGIGDKLFDKYRAKENNLDEFEGQYKVIIVGALMMRAGANISKEQLQHLRDLVPNIDCQYGYALPFGDLGFRDPGKAQFLAALDNYQPGAPRDYLEPSCFHCGKVRADIGKAPKGCGRCERAWYCNVDCQRAHWKVHKPQCKHLNEVSFLNV
ncbi:Putative Zinc finger, MYND-type [Colletotrichum destructivum]|uniref:Zinc finger, MYND-type n=1 Tax=Colletotrichum destructivum TaxID=34406 RepID=A0AAX4IM42_9PEZI|nr:Putative Zinc finger, MYND-type [Colletotrichum destructivum]